MATTTKARRGEAMVRLYISTITIELRKPPKVPIYVGIFINGERVHRLPPIAQDLPLRWSVDLPMDVTPQFQVTFQIKEAHRVRVWQGDLGSCILSDHPNWLKYDSCGGQKEIVQEADKFIISVTFSPPKGIKDTQLIADRATKATDNFRDSILGKLGQARFAVETIVSVLEYVEEVHPIAKAALGTLTKAFKFLEEEEKYDESMRDLALGMADMLSFAEAVNQHAKILQLKDTIAQMMLIVEDASRFILDSQSSSAISRLAVGLVSSGRRNKIDGYIKDFATLRSGFDRGVAVQILDVSSKALQASSGAFQVSSQVLQVVAAAEERSLGEQERLLLKELPRAHSAGYDPSACCMEGTRTQILQDIIDWATQPKGSRFLWLHGPAGCGKSSVASSIAGELQRQSILGATFFCSRDKPELRDPAFVLPTIAGRLAVILPDYGKAVARQLRQDPDIGRSAIQFQYEGLFASPLKKIEGTTIFSRPTFLILVIDALDECGNPKIRATLLKYILEISRLTNWLKVIATSRPEPDITRVLGGSLSCTSFPLPLNDLMTYNDILLFTQTRMAEIRQAKDLQPLDWPGEVRTNRLAEMAGGLFIWAETAYKFIASGYIPEERLNQLLSKTVTPGIYSRLDMLYSAALGVAFAESDSDNIEIFKLVVGTIVTALTPLPVRGLFALLGGRIPEIGIRSVVNNFRSVLYEDEQNDFAIRVCHLSFIEFMTDPLRCQNFYLDRCQNHTALATASLQTMEDLLRFNICDLESSDLFNDQTPDLSERVQNAIPIPLRYSCVHWMTHLRNSYKDVPLVEALERFLQKSVLFWIEALSLLGEISAAIHGLPLVIGWFQDSDNENSEFIADIYRFILGFKGPITRSTPHLYISALPFAPIQSLISQRFLPSFPNTISLDDRQSFWSPCLQTLEGHTDRVYPVSWSPDGQRLVSGSYDRSICVWDSTTGAMMQRLRGHSNTIASACFSPNSRLIASGSWDKTILIWDVETGIPISSPLLGHQSFIRCVKFSPDGKHLASCSVDQTIRIWDVPTGKLVLDPLTGHSDQIAAIAYSPDGTRIVSCSNDRTVRVWDVKTGRTVLGPLTAHGSDVNNVDFSPNGLRILSCSRDCSIVIWDSTTGAILLGPLDVGNSVLLAKFSPDGRLILSTSLDLEIRIWDAESGTELFNQGHSGFIGSACFSPDGQHFVTGSSDWTVQIWQLNSLPSSASSTSDSWHAHRINSGSFSPDGKYIVSGSQDNTVRVWHVDNGVSACPPLRGHTGGVLAVTFSPDSQHILSASWDKTLRLWTVGTWEIAMEPFSGHTGPITCAAFSRDGHFVMSGSGSGDCTIRFWNPATGREVCEPLQGHQAAITALTISSDGHLFGTCSEDETVKIWDSVTRQQLFDFRHGGGKIWSIAFSPDGQTISSYSHSGNIWLWDIQKQAVLWNSSVSASVSEGCCVFSRDGKYLFGTSVSSILILDTQTGSTVHAPLKGHSGFIYSLAISPNGKCLLSSSIDQTIRAWDIEFKDENREELLPDALNMFEPVSPDGWVRAQTGDPLLWIPSEYRDGLWKRAIFSIPPTASNHPRTLDCSQFRHGKAWAEVRGVM